MKKVLLVLLVGLLLCTSAYAKKFKPGSGPLKLSENTVKIFHIYLTEKLSEEPFKAKKLPGSHKGFFWGKDGKPTYADYFLIKSDGKPYILSWGIKAGTTAANNCCTLPETMWTNIEGDFFAKKNKIVWKGGKKRISRKISLEELKVTLKELGFYDGD